MAGLRGRRQGEQKMGKVAIYSFADLEGKMISAQRDWIGNRMLGVRDLYCRELSSIRRAFTEL